MDDEVAVLGLLEIALRPNGYRLTTARNGTDALRCFDQSAFDLVITDKSMPDFDGVALATEIRRRDPQMPILLITGGPPIGLDPALFNIVLSKPFTRRELLTAIKSLI